jgi:small subunit ribosomal protein S14
VAKESMLMRELKRSKLVEKHRKRRAELKELIRITDDPELVEKYQHQLNKLPANSSRVRLTRRCQICGRPHGVYREFNLCRICLRKNGMIGNVPGLVKSSW